MLETLSIFIVSLIVLIKASQYLIDSSIEMAKILKISLFSVGFIMLSVATSIPELFVSIIASLGGNSGIAVGNVIGANIADIAWVLGVTAVLGFVRFKKSAISDHATVLFIMSIIPLILLTAGIIERQIGLILLLIFIFYCFFVIKRGHSSEIEHRRYAPQEIIRNTAVFIFALAIVLISANYIVQSGVGIAIALNVPQTFIGLSIISIGTTLPELTVSVAAIRKKKSSLAIGNILGSCVTNLTLVLGTAAVITPVKFNLEVITPAVIFLLGLNFFIWMEVAKGKITRRIGALMIIAYLAFILMEAGVITL